MDYNSMGYRTQPTGRHRRRVWMRRMGCRRAAEGKRPDVLHRDPGSEESVLLRLERALGIPQIPVLQALSKTLSELG